MWVSALVAHRRRWTNVVCLLAVIGLGVPLLLVNPLWNEAVRHLVFDQYQRWKPRSYTDTAVRIIDIDEESLEKLGQWPWPRTLLADMVEKLQAAGVAAIGFDIVFAEPDRTSPRTLSQQWNLPANVKDIVAGMPDHDAAFATALAGGRTVLGFSTRQERASESPPAVSSTAPLPKTSRFVEIGGRPTAHVPTLDRIVPALPVLANAAAGNGALVFLPDNDGIVRRVPLLLQAHGQMLPSLAAEMLRVGQGQSNYLVRTADTAGHGVAELRIGHIQLPTIDSGEMWVYYTKAAPRRSISAWQILAGEVSAEVLRGSLVVIGSSAQGLMDLRFSALGTVVPGVEVHAQALEQALTDSFLYRPAWALSVEVIALLVGGLLVGTLALATGPMVSGATTAAVLLALACGGWTAFSSRQLLLDPLSPALGIFAAFLLPNLLRHQASEQRRRWVAKAFSRYVSPNLVAHIVRHPEELELGGRRQVCSFVFTDLAGFTGLIEHLDPAVAVDALNKYLDEMVAIAFRHEGTLDRIVGDAVAIMFSAPVTQVDHRQRAVRCALEMQRFSTDFAGNLHARGIPFGRTRIGVHSGEVIVGNFGGNTMFDYRALGDAVNTASRLESANKYWGTYVCVSEATLVACPDVHARRVGRVVLKGKSEPLLVFQPCNDGLDGPLDLDALKRYEAAYDLMAYGDPAALHAFERLATGHLPDPLVHLHIERLRSGKQDDLITMADK